MAGKVYLVGAGPGDRELLTLKAKRLIEQADVIVCDRLVSGDITDMIPVGTEVIDVGKNAGNHPVPQERINEILAEEAEKGKTVVRLKGGDPFVFGRGGEELELLRSKGISFQVVPGITSGVAAPAYAGIPVTHRDFCSSLHFITGHAKKGGDLKLDYDALVRLDGTIVFYMSVAAAGKLAGGLMAAGMDPGMPAAVIENGTRKSPAILMVGKVCSLSENFDWFDELPLKAMKVLVTQPRKKASTLGDKLKNLGADVTMYPCIRTEYIRPLNPGFDAFTVLVFTSAEGIHSFFGWLKEEGLDSRALGGKRIACIGPATARAAEMYGITADFVPDIYDGVHLGKEMISAGFITEDDRLILLRAEKGTEEITAIFDENNITYTDYPVYRTSYVENEGLNAEDFDVITFTSKSCVEGFVKSAGRKDFGGVKALCIGQKTAEEALKYGFDVTVPEKATIDSMACKLTETR